MRYRDPESPDDSCSRCVAWWAEFQRAALLLERLAEDRFPDQESFDRWIAGQQSITLRGRR
jgi:hypothetical protein